MLENSIEKLSLLHNVL